MENLYEKFNDQLKDRNLNGRKLQNNQNLWNRPIW